MLTIFQVAKELGVSKWAVYKLVERGRLPAMVYNDEGMSYLLINPTDLTFVEGRKRGRVSANIASKRDAELINPPVTQDIKDNFLTIAQAARMLYPRMTKGARGIVFGLIYQGKIKPERFNVDDYRLRLEDVYAMHPLRNKSTPNELRHMWKRTPVTSPRPTEAQSAFARLFATCLNHSA